MVYVKNGVDKKNASFERHNLHVFIQIRNEYLFWKANDQAFNILTLNALCIFRLHMIYSKHLLLCKKYGFWLVKNDHPRDIKT